MNQPPMRRPSPAELSSLVTAACVLEASTPKPGNVSPGRPFRDMTYEDFVASAVAIGPPLGDAGERSLGETILAAVTATRAATQANTNLGIILMLAPLAKAVRRLGDDSAARPVANTEGTRRLGDPATRPQGEQLRTGLAGVLAETTVADARLVYDAIRAADPSGMGKAEQQDLSAEPTVTLREAMALAAGRDLVAREYVTDFALTFDTGVPAIRAARAAGMSWEDTTVSAFLTLLAREPDTLIARKLGSSAAEAVSAAARAILALGDLNSAPAIARLAAFDASLRDAQNSRNPGTTADLTAAALFVALLEAGGTADDPRTQRAQ